MDERMFVTSISILFRRILISLQYTYRVHISVAVIKDNCRMCELGVGVIIDAIRDPESQERLKQLASDFCMEYNEDDKLVSLHDLAII